MIPRKSPDACDDQSSCFNLALVCPFVKVWAVCCGMGDHADNGRVLARY